MQYTVHMLYLNLSLDKFAHSTQAHTQSKYHPHTHPPMPHILNISLAVIKYGSG